MNKVTIRTGDPVVSVVAAMQLDYEGISEMVDWVEGHRPECLPEDGTAQYCVDAIAAGAPASVVAMNRAMSLFPHRGLDVSDPHNVKHYTDNELLVELAGRKCYDSFGLKAGKKGNAEYIANTQAGDIPHGSIMYHAKMSFFIAGVSRRVSHELIRHYVGADRDEEGSPSQESTRFTHHYGSYIAHPFILSDLFEQAQFRAAMEVNYAEYLGYVERHINSYREIAGKEPTGLDRKRIYESASPYLSHSCETSFIWTTNPIALAKLLKERDNEAADLEFTRLAKKWKRIAVSRWPNLFPQPWMRQ